MTLSNANPVQFWTSEDDTYNNKSVCGISQVCWCQPWQCDDEIKIQFTDESETSTPAEETIAMPDLPALSAWLTRSIYADRPDWTTGATPSVTLNGTGVSWETSELLYVNYDFLEGYDYSITLDFTRVINSGSSNPRTGALVITDESFTTLFSSSIASSVGANTVTISFTATASCSKIGFYFTCGHNATITVTDYDGTRTGLEEVVVSGSKPYKLQILDSDENELELLDFSAVYVGNYQYAYSLTIVPEDYDICDQEISFRILNYDVTPSEVAYSDCLSIKTAHICTNLITYTNAKNFAGLIYADLSPVADFTIRIPSVFFEEDNPAEQEDHELSNGELVRLYNKLGRRRKFNIGFIPNYMHEKLQLILMHDSVTIDGREWIKRDAYEKTEGNKTYPLKKAQVWLTDKNYIKENQL
jgi:hypothetical protein